MNIVLTIIIVAALIALFAIVATWVLSHFVGKGPVMADLPADEKQATLQGNRAFALHGEYEKVGFSTVKFGYSPAQVDDLRCSHPRITANQRRISGAKAQPKYRRSFESE